MVAITRKSFINASGVLKCIFCAALAALVIRSVAKEHFLQLNTIKRSAK